MGIKSEKAKNEILYTFLSKLYQKDATKIVEIAEQEMLQKAIETFFNFLTKFSHCEVCTEDCHVSDNDYENCFMIKKYMQEFINELNK